MNDLSAFSRSTTGLPMPAQHLDRPYRDPAAPEGAVDIPSPRARLPVFAGSLAAALCFGAGLAGWLATAGFGAMGLALAAMATITAFWIALSCATTVAGLGRRSEPSRSAPPSLDVAILFPVRHENVEQLEQIVRHLAADLATTPIRHRYTLFVLSDSEDPAAVRAEREAAARLQIVSPVELHYRHRKTNEGRKAGNIAEWVRTRGWDWEAFIPLDADSFISAEAAERLADELASDPGAALVQSAPRIHRARTVFGRLQQFSVAIYGRLYIHGLARWTGAEANYWGHNAIIRTRAFAAAAGLPLVGGRTILSHDFVEAALLRRAGWAVRLLPDEIDSFEECPQSLAAFCLRDRRWCRGSLQHLRLLGANGLHPVSRFHLFHGAASYLLSPAWLLLLCLWVVSSPVAGPGPIASVALNGPALVAALYAALVAPKLMSAAVLLRDRDAVQGYGGPKHLVAGVVLAILASVAYAPILMIQQTISVLLALTTKRQTWLAQDRRPRTEKLSSLLRFHVIETILGLACIAAIALSQLSPWLLPVALSLAGSAPLSWLSGRRVGGIWVTPPDKSSAAPGTPPSDPTNSSQLQQSIEMVR